MLLLPLLLACTGCATAPRTYQPPDFSRLTAAVDKATVTAKAARRHVAEAKGHAAEVASVTVTIINDLADLAQAVPPELRPHVVDLSHLAQTQTAFERDLAASLEMAATMQGDLETQLASAQTEKERVQKSAIDLAAAASGENAKRLAAEKKVSWYRWHWWGSWIALGAGVLACGLFALLKFTGRISLTAAQVAAKF